MVKLPLCAAGILAVSVTLSAQIVIKPARIDFKGDRLGMSLSEFKAKHPLSGKCTDDAAKRAAAPDMFEDLTEQIAHGLINCIAPATVVNREAPEGALYKFLDGKLYAIFVTFPHDAFNEAVATAQDKYGVQTATDTEQYQNYFGAQFSGRSAVWIQRGDIVFLKEYTEDLKTSAMAMLDPTATGIADKRLRKKRKDF